MPESLSRLWQLITLSISHLSTGELVVRVALICCSLFALIQLLSMLGTHYGDQNATSKSFFLSLLLHCCFALGWAAVVDSMPPRAAPFAEKEADRVHITMINDGNDSTESSPSSPSTWGATTLPPEAPLNRASRPAQELVAMDLPESERAPSTEPIPDAIPDLPANLETPETAPVQQSAPAIAAVSPAKSITAIDQTTPEARAESGLTNIVGRQPINRESSSIDLSTRIEPQRGSSERMAPVFEDSATLTLPSEVSANATFNKAVRSTDDTIRRRTSPAPTPTNLTESGNSASSTAPQATGNRRTEKFTRVGSRSAVESEFESNPSVKQSPAESTAAMDQFLASRSPIRSEIPGQNPRPELLRANGSPIASRTPVRNPETYRSRRTEQRRATALKNGGSEQSERAVEASLKWMAGIQETDGNWSSSRHGGGLKKKDPQGQDRKDGGLHADAGITGLVVLSYLGAGYTHEEGKYSDVTSRGIAWMIKQQKSNGYLGGSQAADYDRMYCHAMATFALAEAYGMQSDPNSYPELREAVRAAVQLIFDQQNTDGGWRYSKGMPSDMSMFGWQLMALKSAANAGIPTPEETRRGMTAFLQARARGTHGGLAGYKAEERPSPSMTAEALFCRQMFSARSRDVASQEAVEYLRQNLPRLSAYDEYYWYYGTLAMYQHDGRPWQEWNGALRDMLVSQQRTQGDLAGSWDPVGKWGGIGGRLYSTTISTMCLEVYYRYLRIYQSGEN